MIREVGRTFNRVSGRETARDDKFLGEENSFDGPPAPVLDSLASGPVLDGEGRPPGGEWSPFFGPRRPATIRGGKRLGEGWSGRLFRSNRSRSPAPPRPGPPSAAGGGSGLGGDPSPAPPCVSPAPAGVSVGRARRPQHDRSTKKSWPGNFSDSRQAARLAGSKASCRTTGWPPCGLQTTWKGRRSPSVGCGVSVVSLIGSPRLWRPVPGTRPPLLALGFDPETGRVVVQDRRDDGRRSRRLRFVVGLGGGRRGARDDPPMVGDVPLK